MTVVLFVLMFACLVGPMMLVAWAAGEFSSVVSVENDGLHFPAKLSSGETVTHRRGGWYFESGHPCSNALNCKIREKLNWPT